MGAILLQAHQVCLDFPDIALRRNVVQASPQPFERLAGDNLCQVEDEARQKQKHYRKIVKPPVMLQAFFLVLRKQRHVAAEFHGRGMLDLMAMLSSPLYRNTQQVQILGPYFLVS